jgi:hypothetical protein
VLTVESGVKAWTFVRHLHGCVHRKTWCQLFDVAGGITDRRARHSVRGRPALTDDLLAASSFAVDMSGDDRTHATW